MPAFSAPRRLTAFAAVATALIAIHGSAHASADWVTLVPSCAPASQQTVEFATVNLTGGYVTAGRNPPLSYLCTVPPPGDGSLVPTWKMFKLQYSDPNSGGGSIVATLYAKRLDTGKTSRIAELTSANSSGVVVGKVALLKSLSFKTNAYYVTVTMDPLSLPVQAHTVSLTAN